MHKFAYCLGSIAPAISYHIFSTYLIFFYVDIMKLPVRMAAIAMIVYALWNAINDPLAGFISDATRSRFGRRIPYLLIGAIPLGLSFLLLWVPPFRGVQQETQLFIYFMAIICIFDAFYSIVMINLTALFPEMFPDLKERAHINSIRQTFVLIGMLMGLALPPLIFNHWGWGAMGAFFGLIITTVIIIAVWGAKEHKEYTPPSFSIRKALEAALLNRSFISFAMVNLLLQYSFITIQATIPFFAKYILDLSPLQTASIMAAAIAAAILSMLFFWKRLIVRIGLKNCYLISITMLVVFLIPLFFVDSYGQVLLISALMGSAFSGYILMADIVMADIIDEDEVNHSFRREGVFFGLGSFINRFAIGMEAASMSAVFIFSGYTPYIFTQAKGFYEGLRFLIGGLPMIALIIAFVIMLTYPLAGKRLEEVKIKLADIHKSKGGI